MEVLKFTEDTGLIIYHHITVTFESIYSKHTEKNNIRDFNTESPIHNPYIFQQNDNTKNET